MPMPRRLIELGHDSEAVPSFASGARLPLLLPVRLPRFRLAMRIVELGETASSAPWLASG